MGLSKFKVKQIQHSHHCFIVTPIADIVCVNILIDIKKLKSCPKNWLFNPYFLK